MTTIPILFAADNNYIKYLYVAICSLLINSNTSTRYDLYILTPKSYPKNIIKEFSRLQKKYNVSINYVIMGNDFDNKDDKKRFLPSSSYYYLKIADIITEYDKAIYLDPDIIVLEDLSELFNIELDNKYIAGVKAAGYMEENTEQSEYYKSIGLNDLTQYVNANSLVFNLDLIRKDNITEKFCELAKNAYNSMDQDVLNLVCYNRIKHIPFKYNLMVKYLPFDSNKKWSYEFLQKVYGEKELEEAKNPVIIHYANYNEKPWYVNVQLAEMWWEYAKLTPYYLDFKLDYFIKNKIKPILTFFMKNFFSFCNFYDIDNNKYKLLTILGIKILLWRNKKCQE